MNYCRLAYRNIGGFIRYFVFAQLLRLVTIAFPMLFGQTVADARHVLLLGFLMDLAVIMIFALDTSRGRLVRKNSDSYLSKFNLLNVLQSERPLLISTLLGAVLCLVLPNLISLIGVFDNYLFRAEFTFMTTALMQLMLFICVYAGDLLDKKAMKKVLRNRIFLIESGALVLFLVLCFLTPIGSFFGLIKNPIIYLILSLIPPIALAICYAVLTFPKKNEKGRIKTK